MSTQHEKRHFKQKKESKEVSPASTSGAILSFKVNLHFIFGGTVEDTVRTTALYYISESMCTHLQYIDRLTSMLHLIIYSFAKPNQDIDFNAS